MGDIKDELEADIKRFLEQIEGQAENDKVQTLRNLFSKYLHLNSCDFVMGHADFQLILNGAQKFYVDKSMPIFLGDKRQKVTSNEQANYCVILSSILYFNKNNCFNKIPVFDEQEDKI